MEVACCVELSPDQGFMMTRAHCLASLLLLCCATSCVANEEDAARAPIGKADLIGSCAATGGGDNACGAKSDGNCWCDDECADFGDCCADKDAVCDATFDPCAGKTCGEACKLCSPSDPDCVEIAVPKQCSAAGTCEPSPAECSSFCDGCQAGCVEGGCPVGMECVVDPDECVPSACGCDEESFTCICTSDCNGGSCKPAP
jgi:hypothetical protein